MPERERTTVAGLKAFLKRESARPVQSGASYANRHVALRQLEVFREATSHRTLSETAAALEISKVAVRDAINDLQHAFGDVRLFESNAKTVTLTPAGTVLLEKATTLLNDAAAAKSRIGRHSEAKPRRPEGSRPSGKRFTLRQVEIFLEAAQHDTLLAACRSLGVSTSYMSDVIARLEQALGDGVTLFERDTGGAHLTEVGKLFAEWGRQLLLDETIAREAVADAARSESSEAHSPPVSARYHRAAENMLAAVEFLEQRAPAGCELSFPRTLTTALAGALEEIGHAGEPVDRVATILDMMQASVTEDADLPAIIEPGGRASRRFRDLHEISEQQMGTGPRRQSRGR